MSFVTGKVVGYVSSIGFDVASIIKTLHHLPHDHIPPNNTVVKMITNALLMKKGEQIKQTCCPWWGLIYNHFHNSSKGIKIILHGRSLILSSMFCASLSAYKLTFYSVFRDNIDKFPR